ncbi:TerD family protein [Nocardia sp. JW2]|uniref:TerD family protein n=1 Tax=Nocardia sp. JW2 TaxID=3450738 RepID=UPI003F432B49
MTATTTTLDELIVRRTLRVPALENSRGDGAPATRQFDAALMSVGFTLSPELFDRLCGHRAGAVIDTAVMVLGAVRHLVGDHVEHNVYFRDFPNNVPDTTEFWAECLAEALADPDAAGEVLDGLFFNTLNLPSLPAYGSYQHDYADMRAAHRRFVERATDRMTVLHAGDPLDDEIRALYRRLAESAIPLGEDDRDALRLLAERCADDTDPPSPIPIRENRALVNEALLKVGRDILVDTPTDVLRLACALSGGDVTLQEPTRFQSLPRRYRRALLAALDRVIDADPAALGNIRPRREAWKRLAERLHPNEHPEWSSAATVFAIARGDRHAPSIAGRVDAAIEAGNVVLATSILANTPGLLFRSLDRLLRLATSRAETDAIVDTVSATVDDVSGRVILSTREHLRNRRRTATGPRTFTNRKGRAWVTADDRVPLDARSVDEVLAVLDAEISRRLPHIEHLAVDADLLDVALPLSDKMMPPGFGLLPRGSSTPVEGTSLRFFTYWKQAERRTDYDLSALMIDDASQVDWLSYTSLRAVGGVHSGDITSAPDGASEFIDLDLSKVRARYIVPQVNIYSGEGFDDVEESFFGYMLRDRDQDGSPFEPRTVRMKSDLRGPNRVALPLVFVRGDTGWSVHWLHLFLRGWPSFNRVESNQVSTMQMVEGILGRDWVTVRDLVRWMAPDQVSIIGRGATVPEGVTVRLSIEDLAGVKDLIPA